MFVITLRFASICFHLEAGHMSYLNYNWAMGHDSFQKAIKLSNLSFELTGVYGKRTKYQQKDVAQLLLKVNTEDLMHGDFGPDQIENLKGEFTDCVYSNKDMDVKWLPKVKKQFNLLLFLASKI